MATKEQYTTTDVANELGITRDVVLRHIKKGNLSAQKYGRDWLILADEFERFEKERRGRGRPRKR